MALAGRLLVLGDKFLPRHPIALLVVALATGVISLTSLAESGGRDGGCLAGGTAGLPPPVPAACAMWDGILPLSAACFLLADIEGVSAARTLAAEHDDVISPRQELLALGAANLAVAFGQGMPVAGGLSQSAVNDKAGAKTPLALLFASVTLAACLLFLTDILGNLPTVVLAAIVLVAVRGLIDLRGGAAAPAAGQPVRVQDLDRGAGRRAATGDPQGDAVRRRRVVADAARRRGTPARRLPRPHPQ